MIRGKINIVVDVEVRDRLNQLCNWGDRQKILEVLLVKFLRHLEAKDHDAQVKLLAFLQHEHIELERGQTNRSRTTPKIKAFLSQS